MDSPCIAGITSPTIYIPAACAFSSKEHEAIIAHEVEHYRYKDTLVRAFLQCIGSCFWWIPTNWLQKRIEEGQEIGCDLGTLKFRIDPIDLASAIHTSAKHFFYEAKQPFAAYFTQRTLYKRVFMLLHPVANRKRYWVVSLLAAGFAFIVIFLGRFWIF